MTTLAYTVPVAGTDLNAVADPELATALNTIKTWANGNIDAVNLSALLAQSLGANQNAQVVKGSSIIATSESRTNTAYGTLTTPDQVTGIVLPANGLIAVWYSATWQESVNGAASADIFVGANQLKSTDPSQGAQASHPATLGLGSAAFNAPLSSYWAGLQSSQGPQTVGSYTGDVTTGQPVGFHVSPSGSAWGGGPCYVDNLPAGTYTISVQFKASSGNVTASNRRLRVQALSFA